MAPIANEKSTFRQQAIIWTNIEPDLCRHLASLGMSSYYICPCLGLLGQEETLYWLSQHISMFLRPQKIWLKVLLILYTCILSTPYAVLPPGSLHVLGGLELFSWKHFSLNWCKMMCNGNLAYALIHIKYKNIFPMYLQLGVPRHFYLLEIYCCFNIKSHYFYGCVCRRFSQSLAAICGNMGICDVFGAVATRENISMFYLISEIKTSICYVAPCKSQFGPLKQIFKR